MGNKVGLPGSAPEKKVRLEESGGGIFTEWRWEGWERWVSEDDEERKSVFVYVCIYVCVCLEEEEEGCLEMCIVGYLASQGPTGPLACGYLHMVQ